MRRQEVGRPRIDRPAAGLPRLQLGIVLHRSEEAHRAIRIVTGARGDADADGVGLEFLRAGEARQRKLRFGERERADFRIADDVGDDASDQSGLARLLFADRGVAGNDVAHFVRQHRGQLGFVVGERDQPAGDVKLAARQGEGVDRLRIEDGDLVVQIGMFRRGHQPVDGLLQHPLELGIVIDAAIGAEDALMLVQHRGRHVGHVGGFRRARQRRLRRRAKAASPSRPRRRSASTASAAGERPARAVCKHRHRSVRHSPSRPSALTHHR